MIRYLYKNEFAGLYSLDEYISEIEIYYGKVDIHNKDELEYFLERMSSEVDTIEDIEKALKIDEYELISKQLRDFIESPESGTNETIENLVNEIISNLGGDSYCSSVYDYLNECDIYNLSDFASLLFYKTVEKILNVIETFESEK